MGDSIKPLVSIITPVLNGERYLPVCIESVHGQTCGNIEHILVNGFSDDTTAIILNAYQGMYHSIFGEGPLITAVGNNNGVGANVNIGIRLARSEIVAWIDSDDYYEPFAVQTVVDYFAAQPKAMVVYGGCNIIDKDGNPYVDPVPNSENGHFIIKPFDEKEAIEHWAYMVFNSTFYRRQVFEEVGYFNDLGNDLDMWLRINRRWPGGMHKIPQTLANWRYHDQSISLKKAPREESIRFERVKQDFELALKYGYDIMSPRPRRYLQALKERMKQ